MDVKFNNRDPVYVQVIRHFKEQMAKGFLNRVRRFHREENWQIN